ncbi:MAG: hypothetical protein QXF80_03365 [Thermoplasmatales archaeon]
MDLKSVRLDKYYSGQSIFKYFNENRRIFIIPKSNSRIRGKKVWKDSKKSSSMTDELSEGILQEECF